MGQSFARRFASLLRVLDAGRPAATADAASGEAGRLAAAERKPGETVGRYVLEGLLGRGGMGAVYAARDEKLGRLVALKLVEADRDGVSRARALREARASAAFEHPNAVVVFDVGEVGSTTLLAMELVRGRTLRSFIGADVGDTPLARRIRWLADVARALGAAHRVGLVHRDVKPDNVMVRDDGVVKVLDFGIARRMRDDGAQGGAELGGTVTAAGVVVGTPLYLAPEQLRNDAFDGRADQFAWGVMAHELLAGRVPWKGGDNLALVSQILSAEVPPLGETVAELPAEVDHAVARALRRDAADRFATMDELADVLEPFAQPPATSADRARRAEGRELASTTGPIQNAPGGPVDEQRTSAGTVVRSHTTPRTRRRWTAPASIAAAALVGAAALALTRRHTVESPAPASVAPLVTALRCAAAAGSGASADLARAIGVGTCMRLATELGVEWSHDGAGAEAVVRFELAPDGATVTLSVAGREARGRGATPVEAMDAAATELAPRLAAPEATPAMLAVLGASDGASARRIARVWRRVDYRLAPDPEAELARVAESDPGSPWLHLLLANQAAEGSDRLRHEVDAALGAAAHLPAAQGDAVRGFLTLIGRPEMGIAEGLTLLRRAFVAAPDDPDVAVLLAVGLARSGPRDEALAVLARLMDRFPTRSLPAVRQALFYLEGRASPADKQRLHEHLRAMLPETRGWSQCVSDLVRTGQLDEAQRSLDLARDLGRERTDPRLRFARADIALARFRPEEARAIGAAAFAEPQPKWSMLGATYVVAGYLVEGRVAEAQAAQLAEIERQRGVANPLMAVAHALRDARVRRWLDQPPPGEAMLAWLERASDEMRDIDYTVHVALVCEIALARMRAARDDSGKAAPVPGRARTAAAKALDAIERRIDERAAGDRTKLDAALIATLGLVRAARGDGAAAKRWRDAEHASPAQRKVYALDAALAFEGVRAWGEARTTYELARDPALFPWDAFSVVAAEARLAELDRAEGRLDEARARDERLGRALAASDRGLRDALRQLR